jgi:Ca2+-transporting ATPase
MGYFEALTIYFGVFFSALIEAISEYSKDSQWLGLRRELNNQLITVIRGDGQKRSIKIKDMVVGDVIEVKAGDRIPADCILFEEMNIKCDESSLHRSGTVIVPKSLSTYNLASGSDNHKLNPDPFLIAGTKVITGAGKAIICAVGKGTFLNKNANLGTINEDEKLISEETFLENKLKDIADRLSKFGFLIILISVIVQVAFLLIYGVVSADGLFSTNSLLKLAKVAIFSLVLYIVVVPEGLGVAVQIALSQSVQRLKNKSKILIKNHQALQKCGTIQEICISKTGMLTQGCP